MWWNVHTEMLQRIDIKCTCWIVKNKWWQWKQINGEWKDRWWWWKYINVDSKNISGDSEIINGASEK